jgi:hypothetical protein
MVSNRPIPRRVKRWHEHAEDVCFEYATGIRDKESARSALKCLSFTYSDSNPWGDDPLPSDPDELCKQFGYEVLEESEVGDGEPVLCSL